MKLSRPVSWFLLAFGVWSWFIWITFVKNLWQDGSGLAFDDAGDPTGYFWVHLLLAIASFLLGTGVGAVGFRGVRALRQESPQESPQESRHEPRPNSPREPRESRESRDESRNEPGDEHVVQRQRQG